MTSRGIWRRTVEPLINHTPRWMAQGMGYQRLWLWGGRLKISRFEKSQQFQKNQEIYVYTEMVLLTVLSFTFSFLVKLEHQQPERASF